MLGFLFLLFASSFLLVYGEDLPPRHYKLRDSVQYRGLAYSGFRQVGPPVETLQAEDIRSDMALLAAYGVKWIRTYGLDLGQDQIPSIARDHNIDTFIGLGITEITTLDTLKVQVGQLEDLFAKDPRLAPIVVVGNELLYEKIQSAESLALFVRYVQSRGFRAAVADTPGSLLAPANVPLLLPADIILLHVHPFFEKVQDINHFRAPNSRMPPDATAAEYVVRVAEKAQQTYPSRLVLLGETGWPWKDDTRPEDPDHCPWCTLAHQRNYLNVLASRTVANGIGMFLFEAFDESWKVRVAEEGGAAPYWGVFAADRRPYPSAAVVKDWLTSAEPVAVDREVVCREMVAMAECAPADSAADSRVQELLDLVCGQGVLCPYMDFPLMALCPLRSKTAWALSQSYQLHNRSLESCDFDGAAVIKAVAPPDVPAPVVPPPPAPELPLLQAVAEPPPSAHFSDSTDAVDYTIIAAGSVLCLLVGTVLHAARRRRRRPNSPGCPAVELQLADPARRSYGAVAWGPDSYLMLD